MSIDTCCIQTKQNEVGLVLTFMSVMKAAAGVEAVGGESNWINVVTLVCGVNLPQTLEPTTGVTVNRQDRTAQMKRNMTTEKR